MRIFRARPRRAPPPQLPSTPAPTHDPEAYSSFVVISSHGSECGSIRSIADLAGLLPDDRDDRDDRRDRARSPSPPPPPSWIPPATNNYGGRYDGDRDSDGDPSGDGGINCAGDEVDSGDDGDYATSDDSCDSVCGYCNHPPDCDCGCADKRRWVTPWGMSVIFEDAEDEWGSACSLGSGGEGEDGCERDVEGESGDAEDEEDEECADEDGEEGYLGPLWDGATDDDRTRARVSVPLPSLNSQEPSQEPSAFSRGPGPASSASTDVAISGEAATSISTPPASDSSRHSSAYGSTLSSERILRRMTASLQLRRTALAQRTERSFSL